MYIIISRFANFAEFQSIIINIFIFFDFPVALVDIRHRKLLIDDLSDPARKSIFIIRPNVEVVFLPGIELERAVSHGRILISNFNVIAFVGLRLHVLHRRHPLRKESAVAALVLFGLENF